jgi:hypothetical protein
MTSDIENLLREMPLRKPPASLDARVLGAAPQPRRRTWPMAIAGAVLAAAAAVVIALALPRGTETGPAAPAAPPAASTVQVAAQADAAAPVRLEQNWTQVSYEGLVAPDNEAPLRKFRRQTIEHVRWTDPASGLRVEATTPRDEIILIRADVQ